MVRAIFTEKAPKPVGPYSQAVEVGNTLYVSGQIGIDPSTSKLREGFEEQVNQVFRNIQAILAEAGYSRENVVKITVYLVDMSKFSIFNTFYEEFFSGVSPKPVRVTVGVSELPLQAEIEVELIAVKE